MKDIDQTTEEYILDRVAPLFNRKGYVGTSLSDITEVTRLTKGAIYCNFKNKEDLALKAFYKNIDFVLAPMGEAIRSADNAIDKLYAITGFYRTYFEWSKVRGGCPLLNVGIDAQHVNPQLYQAAKETAERLIGNLVRIIEKGKEHRQVKPATDAPLLAGNIYAMIEGGVYLSMLNDDPGYLQNILDIIDGMIAQLKQ
ncbi:MAG TPA: TetR/AcrR family transcriptional regulator [Fluviicola sp.]|nr:TetR/AcrR family transcriptional regulator [Fluviicola sp.]